MTKALPVALLSLFVLCMCGVLISQVGFVNNAEDFTLRDSCQGAWLIGEIGEHHSDRCTAVAQGGTDNLTPLGPSPCHDFVDGPPGTPASIRAHHYDAGTLCADIGPDFNEAEFEADDWTIGCFTKWEFEVGGHAFVGHGGAGGTGAWSLRSFVNGWYGTIDAVFSPDESKISPQAGIWNFYAMTVAGSGDEKMLMYMTVSEADNTLLACDEGNHICNTWADGHNHLTGSLTFGQKSSFRFKGDLIDCAYFNEVLTTTELCSWCRCGIRGSNSGITADRGLGDVNDVCNSCVLLGGATGCGDL